jgi:hypothetical protein
MSDADQCRRRELRSFGDMSAPAHNDAVGRVGSWLPVAADDRESAKRASGTLYMPMPIEALPRDTYLTAVASLMQTAPSSEAFTEAAKPMAAEVAKANNVDAKDLFEAVPPAWLRDPQRNASQADNFVQAAEAVLGVEPARVSPLVARSVASAAEIDAVMALNRASSAARVVFQKYGAVFDPATIDPRELQTSLEAFFEDPQFHADDCIPE